MSDKATDPVERGDPDNVACTCKNCGAVVTLAMSYCPACGAAAAASDNPVLDLAREMTSYDSAIWRTVRALLTRPGVLTVEWAHGHRAGYVAPARVFVVVTLVAFLVLSATGSVRAWREPKVAPAGPIAADAERPALVFGFTTDGIILENFEFYADDIETLGIDEFLRSRGTESGSLEHFAISRAIRKYQSDGWAASSSNHQRNMSLLIYLLLPVFPIFIMLLRLRRPYEQHFVFCLHATSFFFIAACVAAFAGIWLGAETMYLAMLATLTYIVLALRRVYRITWWRAVPSGLFLGSVALSLSVVFAIVSALLVVYL